MPTPLHESLVELAALAPACTSATTAKGVIAESHELLRNALAHDSDPAELVQWYSDVIAGVMGSPAVAELTDGAELAPTGALGRHEILPGEEVHWLIRQGTDHGALAELLASAGITGSARDATPVSLIDAHVNNSSEAPAEHDPVLLQRALGNRPAGLTSVDGLPDHSVLAQVRPTLLNPVADVARWAAGPVAYEQTRTPERLQAGVASGVLTEDERSELHQAWRTGLSLGLRRWVDHAGSGVALRELPGLERSAYGEAGRTIAAALRALAARNNIALEDVDKKEWK